MKTHGLRILLRLGVAGFLIAALVGVAPMEATAQGTEVIVPIEELNGSGVSGDATLTDNGDGTTTIDVLVDGASGRPPDPPALRCDCASLGDVIVPLTDVDEDGVSITTVDIPLGHNPGSEVGPHAINIHLSAEEISTYVACGDVPLADAAAAGGETTTANATTDTPATGVGSTVEQSSSAMALMGMVIAAIVFMVGMSLRRSPVRR